METKGSNEVRLDDNVSLKLLPEVDSDDTRFIKDCSDGNYSNNGERIDINGHSGEVPETWMEINSRTKSSEPLMSKYRTWFNLLVLSFSFLFHASAFVSFENLQSSLNHEEGLGTTGLAVLYAMFIVTSLFVTPVVMANVGAKRIIAVSMASYTLVLATGFYATWSTVIPAMAVVGVGAANLLTSQPDYIGSLAKRYAEVTETKVEDAVNMFFGVFYGIFMAARITGNLISSMIFRRDNSRMNNLPTNISEFRSNITDPWTSSCGADFCSQSLTNNTAAQLRPPKHQIDSFTAACLGLVGAAVILSAVLLSPTPNKHTRKRPSELTRGVVKHILSSRDQQLLIIPTMLRGLIVTLLQGDVSVAFVSCPYGVENVGFVMITQGVVCSIASVVLGKLAKYTGWFPLFSLAFLAQVTVCIAFLLWKPVDTEMYVIFILVALLSLGDVVYLLGLSAIYSLYLNTTAGLPCLRLFMSLGQLFAFAYSSHLCMRYKTYILMGVAIVSILCMAVFFRKKSRDSKLTSEN